MINQAKIRSHVYAAWHGRAIGKAEELVQIGEDIWITDRSIAPHTDPTKQGLVSYGLVLLNEFGLRLLYCGSYITLSYGETYRIDGRLLHSAEWTPNVVTKGLFAALIWDMPESTSVDQFRRESAYRLIEWMSK